MAVQKPQQHIGMVSILWLVARDIIRQLHDIARRSASGVEALAQVGEGEVDLLFVRAGDGSVEAPPDLAGGVDCFERLPLVSAVGYGEGGVVWIAGEEGGGIEERYVRCHVGAGRGM